MAAVFEFDSEVRSRASQMVDVGLTAIATAISPLAPKAAAAELARARRFISGLEADVLADEVTADGDTRGADRLANDGKTSKRERRRQTKRAKANAQSGGKLGKKLADGDLSEEQADLIADAAEQSDGEAANDEEFIDQIAGANPDQGRQIRDDWLNRRKSKDDVQSEHDRQRALRHVKTYNSKRDGLDVTSICGDGVAARLMRDAIRARADEIYQRDGGRELPRDQHPRTRAQREFDAAYELICDITTRPDGRTAHTPPADADQRPTESANTSASTRDTPARRSPAKPTIVIGWTIDGLVGRDPEAMATQIGLGLIPDSVLADYAEHADIISALFDTNGDQLWQGRLKRNATTAQYIALVIRDRGCVLCGASHTDCDAHHLTPYNAPAKGRSDLDQMALICRNGCHPWLHAENLTLFRDRRSGRWRTRPATPDETPPQRVARPGRGDGPQQE